MGSSIKVCNGAFESNIARGKHIGVTQDHDAKHRECPRSDTLDAGKGIFPRFPLLQFRAYFP